MIFSTFWEKTLLAAHSGKKNMVGSTFWGKHMIGSAFLKKNIISSTFEEKNVTSSTFCGKTWFAAHSGEKHGWQYILGKKT